MADLENSVPVTPQTLFRLASVSKPITATAAMQLWEQGKLDLDAPVQKYCPAFPQEYALGWGVSHVAGAADVGHGGGRRGPAHSSCWCRKRAPA